MFIFTKMTQIPVRINNKNPKLASYILSQYGGPDGELGASLRYLSQRFAQTDKCGIALLTDIGTEELGHLEMIGSIVTQLTKGEGAKSFDRYGAGDYYIDHANGVYPASASGVPFTAAYMQSKADPIADIMEDMAADGDTSQVQQKHPFNNAQLASDAPPRICGRLSSIDRCISSDSYSLPSMVKINRTEC